MEPTGVPSNPATPPASPPENTSGHAPQSESEGRNWAPIAIAAALVITVLAAALLLGGRGHHGQDLQSASGAPDPYAANLAISGLAMSESSNLAGGKVTYIDGQIANHGNQTITEVQVQVVFRDYAGKVAQSQRMPITVIRMRDPYIDTAPMTVVPLKAGAQQDFRLIFDTVSPDWSGTLPEMQVLHVTAK